MVAPAEDYDIVTLSQASPSQTLLQVVLVVWEERGKDEMRGEGGSGMDIPQAGREILLIALTCNFVVKEHTKMKSKF